MYYFLRNGTENMLKRAKVTGGASQMNICFFKSFSLDVTPN